MSYRAISPVDGRYYEEVKEVSEFFSELAIFRARIEVEILYLRFLMNLGIVPKQEIPAIHISSREIKEIKEIEKRVGHDVKAVELFIRNRFNKEGLNSLSPYVHIGLTSEDCNSIAYSILLLKFTRRILLPLYSSLALKIAGIASSEAETPMLARTHGRPALPTTFGKEMAVFAVRLAERVSKLKAIKPVAKVSGAVGTYASFKLLAGLDWPEELSKFIVSLGLEPAKYTSQVAPSERLSDILHYVINVNQIMISLARDLWQYQMLDYIHFTRAGKISSSTMPQKVNPVDIENAEGNAEISNSLLVLLAYRLQITRLQRDLSDSAIKRTIGQAFAHSIIACKRLLSSLDSMQVDGHRMKEELLSHPEVKAEAAQISLRLKGDQLGYEKVLESIEKGDKQAIKVHDDYLGFSVELAKGCQEEVKKLLAL
ncbi:MAG: lyase family protein [Nitrososphaerota archaeon]